MTSIEQDIITVMDAAKKGNEGAMKIYYRGNQHLLTGQQRIPFAETAKMSRSLHVESEACVARQREEHLLKVFRWKWTLYLISKFTGFIKILIIYSCCFFPLMFYTPSFIALNFKTYIGNILFWLFFSFMLWLLLLSSADSHRQWLVLRNNLSLVTVIRREFPLGK